MTTYKFATQENSVVLRFDDGVCRVSCSILDPTYLAWLAEGNTPEPADQPDPAAMWERIKAERDRRTQHGGYPAAGKWFHSDTLSRTQVLALVLLGANIPSGLQWKTMDGTFVDMTPTLAAQIFAAAAMQDTATFQAAETHKSAMEASADPAGYDYSTGWPAIYGG